MSINYSKYIDSKGTHYISNSGSDERGQLHGGEAGDQNGKEWQLKAWYNRPWTVVLRYPDISVGTKIAELGIAAALNDKIGYDQYNRESYWKQLEKVNYDPSAIKNACEEDCTAGVTANVKAVGFLMDISALTKLDTNTRSSNMRSRFTKAGFQALTDKKYLSGYEYLLPGDILLYENHHAATNVTRGKYADDKPIDPGVVTSYVYVDHANYYVRKEPNKKAAKIGIAKKGSHVPYLGITTNDWYNVLFNAQEGWMYSKAGPIIEMDTYLTVKKGSWNVRIGPSILKKSLGVVHGGDKLRYLEEYDGNWLKVEYEGREAWISKKAIDSDSLPKI